MDFELESQVEHAGDIDPTLGDVDLDSDFRDNVNDVDPTTCDNSNVPNDLQRNSLQIAPDGLFQPLNFKIFQGENAPGPPYCFLSTVL